MKLAKLFLLILLVPGASVACVNTSQGTAIDGGGSHFGGNPIASIEHARSLSPDARFLELKGKSSGLTGGDFERRELLALEHVVHGRYPQALKIFQSLETTYPGQYNTAANMGTTYELLGDLEQASKWIAEGMHRNAHSHSGTEWLHLAILDARMKLAQDPGYLTREHIIQIPDNAKFRSEITVQGKTYMVHDVLQALQYQLTERAFFVKTQDPVVADLLFSFGQLEARARTLESAVKLLGLAREYGYHDQAKLDEIVAGYRSTILFRKLRIGGLIVAGVLLSVFFLVHAYKKKWFFLSSQDYRKHLEMKKLQEGISPSGAA